MVFYTRIDGPASLAVGSNKAQANFVLTTFMASLVLQRFGIPVGEQPVSISVPIVGIMTVWYFLDETLALDKRRVAIMLGILAVAILSYSYSMSNPFPFVTKISRPSLLLWLLLTSFAILRFSRPMDEQVFFRIVVRVLAFIAICGLVQFVVQFAGLSLFTFSSFVPARFSFEPSYNVVIPFGSGGHYKSNGFFLVEPSTFSQFMAIGLASEWVSQRRPWFVALFLLALFSSVSGTGWLAVGGFVAYVGLTSGARGVATAIGFVCVCVIAFAAISLVFPEVAEMLTGRVGEFGEQGSSGNGRFVTPFLLTRDILEKAPEAFFTGVGPGSSETLIGVAYAYGLSTPVKILLEYGFFTLIMYLALIFSNTRTRRQTAILVPSLIVFLFGGTSTHFAPVLFPVFLITTVANLRE